MAELVYCRRCRRRHKVQAATHTFITGTWWFVSCPKLKYYVAPMRHETTLRWMPI